MKACKSSVCQYVGRSFERTDVPPVATSGQVAGWGAESILRTKCLFIVVNFYHDTIIATLLRYPMYVRRIIMHLLEMCGNLFGSARSSFAHAGG